MDENEAWEKYQGELSPLARAGASVAGKLDTLGQLLNTIGTDTSRTAETVIPQLEGDQNAIDTANEQAAGMGGTPDAGMPPADAGMPPVPGAEDMSAPTGAPDAGMPPAAPGPDMGVGAAPGGMDGNPALDDMGAAMPPTDVPEAPNVPMGDASAMGAPTDAIGAPASDAGPEGPVGGMPDAEPEMDYSMFEYSPEEALNDFISTITETAHSALDQGDTEKVANITGFIDGVKQLWEQYMGGPAMPGGLDPTQSMDMPPAIESEGPAGDAGASVGIGGGSAPAIPESEPAPEVGSDAEPEGSEDKGAEDEKSKDDEKEDVKKSETCDGAEKSEDGETAEGGDVAEGGDAEKATGKTDVGPKEGIKKSFMEARMEEMEAVMNDNGTNYLNEAVSEVRPQLFTYEKTNDFDMNAVLEEFRTGCVKSSRPAPQSVMGGVHGTEEDAMKKSVSNRFARIFGESEAPGEEKSEFEMQLEQFTDGLRAH